MTDSAIQLPQDGDCAFCAYLSGTRPYTILSRDELTATLVTREQRGLPHLLVIPTAHRALITDLTNEEAGAVLIAVREAAQAIDRAYHRPGIAVWQNNGVTANQTISHVHFHVAGTLDDGGTNWGEVEELPLDETERISEHLRISSAQTATDS